MNLAQFIAAFTAGELFQIRDVVVISDNCYLAPHSLRRIVSQTRNKPFAIGMFLGRQERSDFVPSFQLLDRIMVHTARKVTLNEKAAWLFICGRDIFKEGILEAHAGFLEGDLVLLQNTLGECLGIGKWQVGKKIAITRVLDRGDFLRRERPGMRRKTSRYLNKRYPNKNNLDTPAIETI